MPENKSNNTNSHNNKEKQFILSVQSFFFKKKVEKRRWEGRGESKTKRGNQSANTTPDYNCDHLPLQQKYILRSSQGIRGSFVSHPRKTEAIKHFGGSPSPTPSPPLHERAEEASLLFTPPVAAIWGVLGEDEVCILKILWRCQCCYLLVSLYKIEIVKQRFGASIVVWIPKIWKPWKDGVQRGLEYIKVCIYLTWFKYIKYIQCEHKIKLWHLNCCCIADSQHLLMLFYDDGTKSFGSRWTFFFFSYAWSRWFC